jgi:uncharacterized protein with HEPN domain
MNLPDRDRPSHMLVAAREAITFAGESRPFRWDRIRLLAIIKCIEIIDEAAANVTPAKRSTIPAIRWNDIISMRNRLIHAYRDINTLVLEATIVDDLPPMIAALEAALE